MTSHALDNPLKPLKKHHFSFTKIMHKSRNLDGIMPKSHSPFGHKHHILSIDEDIKLHDSKINQVIDDINRIPHKKHTKIPSLIPLIIPPSTPFTTPTKTSKHTK